jgi:hypothetical protein
MKVVPFPRQLRPTVSFSVLEDACPLIDRSKEILAQHGGDIDDFWLTADGDWSMTFDVSQWGAAAVFRQLRKLSSRRVAWVAGEVRRMIPLAVVIAATIVFIAEIWWICR